LTARSNNSIPSLGITTRVVALETLDDLQGGGDAMGEGDAALADMIAAALAVGEDMLNWLGLIHTYRFDAIAAN